MKPTTLKDFLKFKSGDKSGKSLDIKFPIEIKDRNGNVVYSEDSYDFWSKSEFDSNNNKIYLETSNDCWYKSKFDSDENLIHFEDSDDYWFKQEFHSNGLRSYYEDSSGRIIISKYKQELTIKEIEKLLGYKIKVIK